MKADSVQEKEQERDEQMLAAELSRLFTEIRRTVPNRDVMQVSVTETLKILRIYGCLNERGVKFVAKITGE